MKWKLSKTDLKRMMLTNIHAETSQCHEDGCVIHHWSKHNMRSMPLSWRHDRGILERICTHGVGHPDPDAAAHLERIGKDHENIHGCDGCCRSDAA